MLFYCTRCQYFALCILNFAAKTFLDRETNRLLSFSRIYRNAENRICHQTILNIGLIDHVTSEQLNKIQKRLTDKFEQKQTLFEEEDDPNVKKHVLEFWQRIIDSKKIDIVPVESLSRMVHIDTIKHNNIREIGAEWMCYNIWDKLKLTEFLLSQRWTTEQAALKANELKSAIELKDSKIENIINSLRELAREDTKVEQV